MVSQALKNSSDLSNFVDDAKLVLLVAACNGLDFSSARIIKAQLDIEEMHTPESFQKSFSLFIISC